MAKFGYTNTKTFGENTTGGTQYATTYYHQTPEERNRLKRHLAQALEHHLGDIATNHEKFDRLMEPAQEFPREKRSAGYYSAGEVAADLYEYVVVDLKDPPSGMLGRWNKLFEGSGWDIEFEQGYSHRAAQFEGLFE